MASGQPGGKCPTVVWTTGCKILQTDKHALRADKTKTYEDERPTNNFEGRSNTYNPTNIPVNRVQIDATNACIDTIQSRLIIIFNLEYNSSTRCDINNNKKMRPGNATVPNGVL